MRSQRTVLSNNNVLLLLHFYVNEIVIGMVGSGVVWDFDHTFLRMMEKMLSLSVQIAMWQYRELFRYQHYMN